MANFLRMLYGIGYDIMTSHFLTTFVLELKLMLSHIMIHDCLDFHLVKKMWKCIQGLFWNSISNIVLRFVLFSVYIYCFIKTSGYWDIKLISHSLLISRAWEDNHINDQQN